MEWSTACPDWSERLLAGKSLVPCPPLFPAEAEAALDAFKGLRIVDAPDSPRMGDSCRDWVFDFASAIFGAYDPETGRRLINDFFLLISKKNSKSTTAAGIMTTALLLNWRKSAEFIILAPTIEIARNSAEPAMDMVNEDPELRRILKPIAHERTIEHLQTGASLKIVAADEKVVGGKKATGVLIDELWIFGKMAKARSMIKEAMGGLASRPEGFVIALSTQSDEPPAGIFAQTLKKFRDIRDGKIIAPRSLGVLYEFPEAMVKTKAYEDPANWGLTNPNLGLSVDEQFLRDQYEEARGAGKDALAGFFAKHLNVEVGMALRADRWAGADFWEASVAPEIVSLEYLIEHCEVVTVGIDGGGLDDLLGLSVVGRENGTRRWLSWCHGWANKIVLERRKDIASVLRDFEQQGDLTIFDIPGQDIEEVCEIVERLNDSGLLPAENGVGVDPVGIGQIVDELTARELPEKCIIGISQGWKLSGAIKTAERGLNDKTLVHAKQPIVSWCVGNAKVEPKGNAVTITKQAAGSMKIDLLMALFNAVALMAKNPDGGSSVYEERGLIFI